MREATKVMEGRSAGIALLLIIVLHLLLCILARPGFMASDDFWYAKYANDLARGEFSIVPDSFANRPGLIAPTALAYGIFGVSEASSVLWPVLCSVAAIVLAFHLGRGIGGGVAGVTSASLVGLNSAQLGSSLLLLPDGPTATLLLAAIVCLLLGRRSASRGRRLAAASLLALFVTMSFLTKTSAVWIVPLLLVVGTRDVLRHRNRDFWAAAAALLVVAGAGYLLAYRALTGDAFYRLAAIEGGHNLSRFSYVGRGVGALAARLTWEPLGLFLRRPELGVPVLLAVPAAAAGLRGDGDRRILAIGFFTFLAAWWFLTTSLTDWTPLPLNPRMFHPVLLLAAILAGATLVRPRFARVAAVLLLAAGLAAWPLAGAIHAAFFVGTGAAVAVGATLADLGQRVAPLLATVPLVLLAVYGVARGGVGETRTQAAERRIVAEHLADPEEETVAVMVERSAYAVRFRLGFAPSPRLTILTGEDAARALTGDGARPAGRLVVFANDERLRCFDSRREAQLDLRQMAAERGMTPVDYGADVTLFR